MSALQHQYLDKEVLLWHLPHFKFVLYFIVELCSVLVQCAPVNTIYCRYTEQTIGEICICTFPALFYSGSYFWSFVKGARQYLVLRWTHTPPEGTHVCIGGKKKNCCTNDSLRCYKTIAIFNFKRYLFYNNNTRLQIGHEVILSGGELIRTFSVRENHWNFFPGWKTQTYSCWLWDLNPRPPSNSVVVITPRFAHRLNHSDTRTLGHWALVYL